MTKDISYVKVLSEDSSFQLVRTNPKLTGNLKIVVNETGDMWLNAIAANQELAKEEYSRFPIDVRQSLGSNIYRFFKNGETPNEIIFSLSEKVDLTKTSKDFKDQYDFSNYFSGVKYLPSNKYSERLSYFAPLYLKKEVPNFFVILKIKDPINDPIDINKTKFESNQSKTEYLIDLFKKATIIKTFDLRESSKTGKFIRDYINSPEFPVSPLRVSFEEDEYTTWNGILINSGSFGSKGELLYNEYVESTPLKFFEENITRGYERNGIIFPNILNLEFIFDDDSSENYEINRYIGFYVNSIDLSELDIDLERSYLERSSWPNTPRFRQKYLESDDITLTQSNPNGVVLPYRNLNFNLDEFSEIFKDSENLFFTYLTDRDNKFHLPNLEDPFEIDFSPEVSVSLTSTGMTVTATSVNPHGYLDGELINILSSDSDYTGAFFVSNTTSTGFTYTLSSVPALNSATGEAVKEIGFGKIRLSDQKLDLGRFFGPSQKDYLQDTGFISESKGFPFIGIKINSNLSDLDSFKLYHPSGTRLDSGGKYDLIVSVLNYQLTPNPGDSYIYNDFDQVVGYDTFYFNGAGLTHEIAKAIAACLNGVRNRSFTAYPFNDYVFIKCNVSIEDDSLYRVQFDSPDNIYSSVEIDNISGNLLINNEISFSGGSNFSGNRLVIDADHLSKITSEFDNLLVKTQNGWSKLKKVSKYIDLVTEKNSVLESNRISAISGYESKIVIALEDQERPSIAYGEFLIKRKFRPQFGIFSLFPIKDLDFDFYSSTYLNFPNIDFYQYYYIPEKTQLLVPGVEYIVVGGEVEISEFPNPLLDGQIFTVTQPTEYVALTGNALITFFNGTSLTNPIYDENGELTNFQGFSILKDPEKVVPQEDSLVYSLRTKYLNGLTSTEYDFYKENESRDFATRSKVIPYITKWGIKNGLDSRSNPYRLNTEIVFGRNNFSPDHTDRTQNPNNFTHEWFYVESKFNYTDTPETIKQNDSYFETPLDFQRLISEPDYFIEYFTYTPNFNLGGINTDVAPTQFRYSNVFKNIASKYETFFKGFKVSFKDVTTVTVIGEDSKPLAKETTSRFEGYKFSCILKAVQEDFKNQSQAPIKYRVVEHKDFKFILIIIEVAIGHINQINDYWKELPFSPGFTSISNVTTDPDSVFYADSSFSTLFGSELPFQTVNGDYRISFSSVDSLDISNLNYTLLYSLTNKKFNSILDNFSNVKLSSKLGITQLGTEGVFFNIPPTGGTIAQKKNLNIPNYPSLLSDEFVIPTDKTFIYMENLLTSQIFFIDSVNGITPNNVNPINSATDEFLTFEKNVSDSLYLTAPFSGVPYVSIFGTLPISTSLTQVVQQNFLFYVMQGGEKYFEKAFEKLSFAEFKKFVNELNSIVEYESYSLDSNGNPISSSSPNFYLEVLDPAQLIKNSQVISQVDEERPTQFAFTETIGFKYEQVQVSGKKVELNRYKGEYEPITKNILHFQSNFKFTKNAITDLKLSNVRFNSNIEELLEITNFNHIKVSPTKVLELESDPEFLPIYPRIKEIPIGQADYFLLQGNWDWGFHHLYLNKEEFSPAAGARRVEEDSSFLGKILIVPNEIELEDYQVLTLGADTELESIDLTQIELVVKEKASSIEGFINLNNVITRYFLNDGIAQKFNEFLINSNEYIGNFTNIQEYVIEYIRLNILGLYVIDTTEFYEKRNATLVSSTISENPNSFDFISLNDQQRFNLGYKLVNNIEINNYDRLILKFSILKPVSAGLNISPKIKIKFI